MWISYISIFFSEFEKTGWIFIEWKQTILFPCETMKNIWRGSHPVSPESYGWLSSCRIKHPIIILYRIRMSPIRGHHIPESGTSCPRIGDTISHSSGHRFWTKVICAQSNCLGKSDLVLVRVNCFRNQVKLFVFHSRFEDHSKRTPNWTWFPDFLFYQQPEFFECIFKPRGNNLG